MNEGFREDEIEIDLMEVCYVFLRKWWLIIGVGILCGALSFVGTKTLITPMYESQAMIYLLSKTNAITSALDIQLGSQMTDDFMILATSRPVVEEVIKKEKLDITYEEMIERIEVSNPSNTQILKIAVRDEDPELACELANAMAEATSDSVADIMNTERPNIVEKAIVTTEPASPSLVKNAAFGALFGVLLVMAILLVNYMLDDRVKTEEDVEKYLQLITLATIPMMDGMQKEAPQKTKEKRKNKVARSR